MMKDQCWKVKGVHEGKLMSELPITYLLWFVGSPVMRRNRWGACKVALAELSRRLADGTSEVESDLAAELLPKSAAERNAINLRRSTYRQLINSNIQRP